MLEGKNFSYGLLRIYFKSKIHSKWQKIKPEQAEPENHLTISLISIVFNVVTYQIEKKKKKHLLHSQWFHFNLIFFFNGKFIPVTKTFKP